MPSKMMEGLKSESESSDNESSGSSSVSCTDCHSSNSFDLKSSTDSEEHSSTSYISNSALTSQSTYKSDLSEEIKEEIIRVRTPTAIVFDKHLKPIIQIACG